LLLVGLLRLSLLLCRHSLLWVHLWERTREITNSKFDLVFVPARDVAASAAAATVFR
jgi:hypothetical protein